jgi:NADH-quinone oxidoreductase subunit N
VGHGWLLVLAAVGAVNVVVSMYYYLCVVKRMYMMEPTDDRPIPVGAPAKVAILTCAVLCVVIGVFQGPFVRMATSVIAALGG